MGAKQKVLKPGESPRCGSEARSRSVWEGMTRQDHARSTSITRQIGKATRGIFQMRLQAASENRAKAPDEAARPAMLERQKHVLLKHQKLCAGRTRGKMTQHDRLDGSVRSRWVCCLLLCCLRWCLRCCLLLCCLCCCLTPNGLAWS